MVKRLMYSVFVFVLVTSAVFAGGWDVERAGGYARIVSLGSNPYVMDPFYVTLNPAWGSVYDDWYGVISVHPAELEKTSL